MKKVLLILFLFSTLGAFIESDWFAIFQCDYFVDSVNGNDSNSGSFFHPWKTSDKINSMQGSFNAGDVIGFKRGSTFDTLRITQSGTSDNYITYRDYGSGEKPLFKGYQTLSGTWSFAGSGRWYKTIDPQSAVNMVIIDGVHYAMGRYPNEGSYLTYEGGTTNTKIYDTGLGTSTDRTGAEVVVFKNAYKIDRGLVTNHTVDTLTYTDLGSGYSIDMGSGDHYYFFQNALNTLDQFGEWYYDTSTKRLYVYFGSESRTAHTIQVSVIDNLITNASADYLRFKGLSFKGSNKSAVSFASGTNYCEFENCEVRFSGADGFTLGGTYNSVKYSEFKDIVGGNSLITGGGGVTIVGTNGTVSYCKFEDMGRKVGQAYNTVFSMAATFYDDNATFIHNEIDGTIYSGLYIMVAAQYAEIAYNDFDSICLILPDAGAIYMGYIKTGVNIHHNLIQNSGGNGIYLDETCNGVNAYDNTIAFCSGDGIKLHKAHDDTLTNNTLYRNSSGINFTSYLTTNALYNNYTSGNKIISIDDQLAVELIERYTGGSGFGINTGNYYARPTAKEPIFYHSTNEDIPRYRLKADWTTITGTDSGSTNSTSRTENSDSIYFYYNNTLFSKTYNLHDTLTDAAGNTFHTSITLASFESKVLWNDDTLATHNYAVLGENSVYATNSTVASFRSMPFVASQTGEITDISIYHVGGSGYFQLGVYDNQATKPDDLLGKSAAVAISGSTAWQTLNLIEPVSVTTGDTIWMAWVWSTNPGIKYQSGAAPGMVYNSSISYSGYGLPASTSVTGTLTGSTSHYSVYGTLRY